MKLPVHNTVLYGFLLYHFQAPEWLWGVFITFFLILWTVAIWALSNQSKVDLDEIDFEFKSRSEKRSLFADRLESALKAQKELSKKDACHVTQRNE